MADITFEELIQAVDKLSPAQKTVLRQHLQPNIPFSLEDELAELATLRRAGAFEGGEDLFGKYARPDIEVSEEELNTYLREIGRAWEQELDELNRDN